MAEREGQPFRETSGCGLALLVLIAAIVLGFVWQIVTALW